MAQLVTIDGKEVSVEQLRSDWALALMQQGIIVKLSLSMWRATSKLDEESLGLKFVDDKSFKFAKTYIKLGSYKLLPPDILREFYLIDGKARLLLQDYSFNTVWGRFVPYKVFADWERKNQSMKDEFYSMANSLVSHYDEIVSTVKKDYRNMARDVWARLYPENKDNPSESFLEEFSHKIVSKIPSAEDMVKDFKYQTTYSLILLPSVIQENALKADRIKRENDVEELKISLEKETMKRISEEYISKKTELIDGFLKSTVESMREYISELCNEVLKSLGKYSSDGDINLVHYKKLKNMINKVRGLNFYGDRNIDRVINELDVEINKFKGKRNNKSVSDKLKQIIEVSKKELSPEDFNPTIDYLEI